MLDRVRPTRFLVFAAVGASATLLQYLVLIVLVEASIGAPAQSSAVGYIVSAFLNYYLNKRLTFRSNAAHAAAGPRFIAIVVLGLAVTYALMSVATEAGLPYLIAQVATTVVVLLLNYFLASRWVFK